MKTLKRLIQTNFDFGLFVLILPLAALFTGCVSLKGPTYSEMNATQPMTPPVDKGMVFIYSHHLPLGTDFSVWANEKLVSSKMGYGKYFYFQADPGQLHIASRGDSIGSTGELGLAPILVLMAIELRKLERINFNVEPGKTYYVDMHNGFARETMTLVSNEVGEKKIQDCHWANSPLENQTP